MSLRKEVLDCFKSLHKTRKLVFGGDDRALTEARKRINEEYRKNKNLNDMASISELLVYSKAVEHELRTTVMQATETRPGIFEVKIRPDTIRLDNVPFKDCSTRN